MISKFNTNFIIKTNQDIWRNVEGKKNLYRALVEKTLILWRFRVIFMFWVLRDRSLLLQFYRDQSLSLLVHKVVENPAPHFGKWPKITNVVLNKPFFHPKETSYAFSYFLRLISKLKLTLTTKFAKKGIAPSHYP